MIDVCVNLFAFTKVIYLTNVHYCKFKYDETNKCMEA